MITVEELNLKIDKLKLELQKLENEKYRRTSNVLMYSIVKGKHTFVLQPRSQKDNLLQNGWKQMNVNDMVSFLDEYIL